MPSLCCLMHALHILNTCTATKLGTRRGRRNLFTPAPPKQLLMPWVFASVATGGMPPNVCHTFITQYICYILYIRIAPPTFIVNAIHLRRMQISVNVREREREREIVWLGRRLAARSGPRLDAMPHTGHRPHGFFGEPHRYNYGHSPKTAPVNRVRAPSAAKSTQLRVCQPPPRVIAATESIKLRNHYLLLS